MKLLCLELYKCRRRNIFLICAMILGVELFWMGVYFARQDIPASSQCWPVLLYNLSTVDAIVLPLSIATLASRSCEPEHKGSTWKLLETLESPGSLYGAKLSWGVLVLGLLALVRSGLFIVLGLALGFPARVPLAAFAAFTALSWAVSLVLFFLQLGLSLCFANQAPALISGISGSFLGILSMLFPPALIRLVPWGYYGLLATVGMDWDPITRVTRFYWQTPQPLDLLPLSLWGCLFLVLGRAAFVKKEV